jgi:hypothetical protein
MKTTMKRVMRSVQLAVMATPTTTVTEAAAEARRRHEAVGAWLAQLNPPAPVSTPVA